MSNKTLIIQLNTRGFDQSVAFFLQINVFIIRCVKLLVILSFQLTTRFSTGSYYCIARLMT